VQLSQRIEPGRDGVHRLLLAAGWCPTGYPLEHFDQDRSAAEEYATREKLPFPILLDPASKAAGAYSVEAIPTMFVIDKDGKILFATTGVEPALEARLSFQLGIRNANGQLNDRSDAE